MKHSISIIAFLGMFASHYRADPRSKMVVVFMRNIWPTWHWNYGERIKPLIYQALLK